MSQLSSDILRLCLNLEFPIFTAIQVHLSRVEITFQRETFSSLVDETGFFSGSMTVESLRQVTLIG